ncbi:MAG: glycosyltransferase family 2 protein [bacterium]|nr:glycosyltransferase family 2 protein [bacterium]
MSSQDSVSSQKLISLVVPVFREEKNLRPFLLAVKTEIDRLPQYQWEFIFVNDGSPDSSQTVLELLCQEDERVKVVEFSRNFGKEIALSAGIHHAAGAAAITLDADLQHPPALIPKLLAQWEAGAEIVATIRVEQKRQPLMRRIGSGVFYWVMSKISSVEMVNKTTDYRLIDKTIINRFNVITERSRMYRGIIDWMGYRKVYVEFVADERSEGVAGYSYGKLLQLAIDSVTSFSIFPLKLAAYMGLLITGLSGLGLAASLTDYLMGGRFFNVTPSAIVIIANMLLNGIVLMCLGFIALYIGNIHGEVINRPLYLIRKTINLPAPTISNEHDQ